MSHIGDKGDKVGGHVTSGHVTSEHVTSGHVTSDNDTLLDSHAQDHVADQSHDKVTSGHVTYNHVDNTLLDAVLSAHVARGGDTSIGQEKMGLWYSATTRFIAAKWRCVGAIVGILVWKEIEGNRRKLEYISIICSIVCSIVCSMECSIVC